MKPPRRSWPITSRLTSLPYEFRELAARDRLMVGDRRQHQHFGWGERTGLIAEASRRADGIAETLAGAVLPAAGDRDEIIRSAAQLVADVVDDEVEIAILSHHPGEDLAADGFR